VPEDHRASITMQGGGSQFSRDKKVEVGQQFNHQALSSKDIHLKKPRALGSPGLAPGRTTKGMAE